MSWDERNPGVESHYTRVTFFIDLFDEQISKIHRLCTLSSGASFRLSQYGYLTGRKSVGFEGRLSQISVAVNLVFGESDLTNTVKQNRTDILSTPNSTPVTFVLYR